MEEVGQSEKRKSKTLAFLLSIFLGFLGLHNFYLGRWKKGLIQFFLVLLTFGAGLIITLPWAWFEGLLILIGKYSLTPKSIETPVMDEELIQSQNIVVNSKKEYFIAFLISLPILALSVSFMGIPLLFAVLFYFIVGWLWNKITLLFIKLVLPLYATVFSSGKKFLIRFSEYTLHPTETRPELFRATRKLSVTAIFVLFFLISLIAQANISMVTEGDIPDAVMCEDGQVELFGGCDVGEESECDSSCVLNNSEPMDRIFQAYSTTKVMSVLLFAPFITILVAPILVLRYSSLSIVDKKTRSITPIGEKANDLTNVGAGFGSIVLFFQTAWRISSAAAENGDIMTGIGYVAGILVITVFMVLLFYPLIWLPMLKFTKEFESHVLLLDDSLVESKGIEVHQLTYDNNELRIKPMSSSLHSITNPPQDEGVVSLSPNQLAQQEIQNDGPDVESNPHSTDVHGYEWIVHNGKNFYRPTGQKVEWQEYRN